MKHFKQIVTGLLAILLATSSYGKGRIQNEDVKSLTDITAAVLTTTGNISSSSACITSIGSTTGLAIGQFVYDTTVPAHIGTGVTIAGLPGTCSAGQVQMSSNAVTTATGDTLTFGGQLSQLINTSKIYDSNSAQQLSTTIPLLAPLASPTFSGYVGVGGAGVTQAGINVVNTNIATVNQWGILSNPTFQSSATNQAAPLYAQLSTAASAFTLTKGAGVFIDTAIKGSGSTITTNYGLYINTQNAGSSNFSLFTVGSAPASFGGNITVNGVYTSPGNTDSGTGTPRNNLSTVNSFVVFTGNAALTINNLQAGTADGQIFTIINNTLNNMSFPYNNNTGGGAIVLNSTGTTITLPNNGSLTFIYSTGHNGSSWFMIGK